VEIGSGAVRNHAINPVFYVEYENTSGADKTILEVVGHDGQRWQSRMAISAGSTA